jgi:hypothetical protein
MHDGTTLLRIEVFQARPRLVSGLPRQMLAPVKERLVPSKSAALHADRQGDRARRPNRCVPKRTESRFFFRSQLGAAW